MIMVSLTFQIPKEQDLKALRGKFEETAPMYQNTGGLIRKNYICGIDKSISGGICCFEKKEHADSWFDRERIEWLTNRYLNPNTEYFDSPVTVDNVLEEILT